MLAEVSGLTADFVRLLLKQQERMEVVREARTADELERVLQTVEADVVVTALSSAEVPSAYHGLVFRIPSIAVVAIGADRSRVAVYNGRVIRGVALDELVGVIREVVGPRPQGLASSEAKP